MKKILLFTFMSALAFATISAQTERMVLVESFTQASCGPCASQNPGFDALLDQNPGKVVVLKYQTSWPGYDPMNEQNPDEVQTRVTYYGVTGVPNVQIDGTLDAGTSGQVTQAQIDNAYAIPAELEIELTHEFSADYSQMIITCNVTNPDMMNEFNVADAYLRAAIVEEDIVFPGGAPGSNGETHFNSVMRKMLPDATGTSLDAIEAGGTASFTWTVDIPNYIYDYTELSAVAFVQSEGSKTVYQAAVSAPVTLPDDIPNSAFSSDTEGPSGLCEYALTPKLTVENDGDVEITTFDVSYLIEGGSEVVENWTGSLMPNDVTTVEFPTVSVDPGETIVSYFISNVNGYPDIYAHNDDAESEAFYTLAPDPVGPVTEKGFEEDVVGGNPSEVIVEKNNNLELAVIDKAFIGSSQAAGGYGESEQAIFFYFWGIQNFTSRMTFQKLDWTDRINDSLTFDVTYRQYQAENDRLEIHVSTDCGVTWTSVFNKAGSDLATLAANTANYLNPAPGDWRTEVVDLSAYDGSEEVVVRFSATSGYGNNMYIDNINIGGDMVSGIEDVIAEGNVSVYPNPVSATPVNIDFTLMEASNTTIQVFDVTGKLVNTLADNEVMNAGNHIVKWNNTSVPGMYFVKVTTEEGQITRKVQVVE